MHFRGTRLGRGCTFTEHVEHVGQAREHATEHVTEPVAQDKGREPAPLAQAHRAREAEEAQGNTQAMTERFVLRMWQHPLPLAGRQPEFCACARCFAVFVMQGAAEAAGSS